MKLHHLAPLLLLVLILTACSPAPVLETPLPPSTHVTVTNTPIPPTLTPTDIPAPTETTTPQLSAQSTFEVIAAMHAYLLMVEEWNEKDVSLEESQAVLQPLLEFGFNPLRKLLFDYKPYPQMEAEWWTCQNFSSLLSEKNLWTEWDWEDLLDYFKIQSPISKEMIESAILIAEEAGVDTTLYGADYAGAIDAANSLLPEITIDSLPASFSRGELNPNLVLVQITPFTFDYAGSEIFYTIGTIENTSNTPQTNVTIEVTYYNFLDEDIGTVRGRLLADVANPGGIYPFIATDEIAGEEEALKEQTRNEVMVFSSPASAESHQSFEITNQAKLIINNQYYFIPDITNIGTRIIINKRIQVWALAFDYFGNLIGIGESHPYFVDSLAIGESINRVVIIQTVSDIPYSYQFFAEVIEE